MNKNYIFFLIILASLGLTNKAEAHGSQIEYQSQQTIVITAKFDDGTLMKNAQVVIYAPQDPTTPWTTGITDQNGQFMFIPDLQQHGNWDVKVRQAGHGNIISIPLNQNNINYAQVNTPNNNQYTPLQKIIMGVSVIWGLIGTTLFFKSKN